VMIAASIQSWKTAIAAQCVMTSTWALLASPRTFTNPITQCCDFGHRFQPNLGSCSSLSWVPSLPSSRFSRTHAHSTHRQQTQHIHTFVPSSDLLLYGLYGCQQQCDTRRCQREADGSVYEWSITQRQERRRYPFLSIGVCFA
jgi:hypothetical protein